MCDEVINGDLMAKAKANTDKCVMSVSTEEVLIFKSLTVTVKVSLLCLLLLYLLASSLCPPFPLILSLLPPSEQTGAKSLNIPNIQRNPEHSLSPSLSPCRSLTQTHRNPHAFLQVSLSLSHSLLLLHTGICMSLSLSLSGGGLIETELTENKTEQTKE